MGIFLKDVLLNFALNQSINFTDDIRLMANITLYRHLGTEAAHWKAQANTLNYFGEAYHKMQVEFQEGYGGYTQELKAV